MITSQMLLSIPQCYPLLRSVWQL